MNYSELNHKAYKMFLDINFQIPLTLVPSNVTHQGI